MPDYFFVDRLNGIQPRSEIRASGHKFTAVEEESLVKQLDANKWGFPIRPGFLRGMEHILLLERTRDPTSP